MFTRNAMIKGIAKATAKDKAKKETIKTNTTEPEFKVIKDKKDEPKYPEVKEFVGGMVEAIQFPNGDLLLLNEEGKLIGLPLNPEATALWRMTFTKETHINGYDDWVSGPAILIKAKALDSWAN